MFITAVSVACVSLVSAVVRFPTDELRVTPANLLFIYGKRCFAIAETAVSGPVDWETVTYHETPFLARILEQAVSGCYYFRP